MLNKYEKLYFDSIVSGSVAGINKALANGVDVNTIHPSGFNGAYIAINRERPGVVNYLVDRGINVDFVRKFTGYTTLMHALYKKDEISARILLAKSDNVLHKAKNNMNALRVAEQAGMKDLIPLIKEKMLIEQSKRMNYFEKMLMSVKSIAK